MKKTLAVILSAIIGLMVVGCKEGKCDLLEATDGEVLPDECYDCQWHALESASLSATDYNTVRQARDCFVCHRETLKEHDGDTIKLGGWLYWGSTTTGEWMPEYTRGEASEWVYLTDREDHLGGQHLFTVRLNPELKERFHEHNNELLGKRWFVIGVLKANDLHIGGCCSLVPVLAAFEFDTVNRHI